MDLFDELAARRLGLGRSDLRALNLLEHGPVSAAALADGLGLTRTSVTALVDRLVLAGYATRNPTHTIAAASASSCNPPPGARLPASTARSASTSKPRPLTSANATATPSSQRSRPCSKPSVLQVSS
jgi:hypothetical protein